MKEKQDKISIIESLKKAINQSEDLMKLVKEKGEALTELRSLVLMLKEENEDLLANQLSVNITNVTKLE